MCSADFGVPQISVGRSSNNIASNIFYVILQVFDFGDGGVRSKKSLEGGTR